MAAIDPVAAVELAGRAGYFVWEKTRTSLAVNVKNLHPHIRLCKFNRYMASGKCSYTPDFDVLPMRETTAKFDSNDTAMSMKGCLVCQLSPEDSKRESLNNLYMLVAWHIKLDGNCRMFVHLVETPQGRPLTDELLKEHFEMDVEEKFQKTNSAVACSWNIGDTDTTLFTVRVSLTDVKNAIMNVEVVETSVQKSEYVKPFLPVKSDKSKMMVKCNTLPPDEVQDNAKESAGGLAFKTSLTITIQNFCDGIKLVQPESVKFDGRVKTPGAPRVDHKDRTIIKLKSTSMPFTRTSGCAVYKLEWTDDTKPPLCVLQRRPKSREIGVTHL